MTGLDTAGNHDANNSAATATAVAESRAAGGAGDGGGGGGKAVGPAMAAGHSKKGQLAPTVNSEQVLLHQRWRQEQLKSAGCMVRIPS
jgi:hypothetical protein